MYLCTGNYKASSNINKFLKSTDTVKVEKINEGYFFDGPGEETAIIFYPGAKVEYTSYARLMYLIAENGKDCFLIKMPFNMAIFGTNKAKVIISKYNYDNYYLSGHSLGGAMANLYVSNNPDNIKGIIALASYSTKYIPINIKYISIYGSNDQILNKKKYEENKKYLPEDYIEYVIDGGNHAYFGNYGKQKGDGSSTITNDEQQDYVVKVLNELGI